MTEATEETTTEETTTPTSAPEAPKDEPTAEELQASMSELQSQLAALTKPAPKESDEPKWSDGISIGKVGGNDVTVQIPLNKAAAKQMTPASYVALAIHGRLQVVEKFVQHLARIEAKRFADANPQVAKSMPGPAPKEPKEAAEEAPEEATAKA